MPAGQSCAEGEGCVSEVGNPRTLASKELLSGDGQQVRDVGISTIFLLLVRMLSALKLTGGRVHGTSRLSDQSNGFT